MKIRRWWWMTTSSLLVYLTISPSSAEKSSDNCKTEHFHIFVNFKKLLVSYVSIDMPGSGASAGSWGDHIIHYIIVMSLIHLASSLIFFSALSPVLSSLFLFRLLLEWIRYTHSTTQHTHSYSYSHTHTHAHTHTHTHTQTHTRTHTRTHTHTHAHTRTPLWAQFFNSTLHQLPLNQSHLHNNTTQHNYYTIHWPWLTLSPSGNTVCSTISSISVTKKQNLWTPLFEAPELRTPLKIPPQRIIIPFIELRTPLYKIPPQVYMYHSCMHFNLRQKDTSLEDTFF